MVKKPIPHSLMQRQVAKVWKLFISWERSQWPQDYDIYMEYREMADKAIAAGPPAWKKEFKLP
jgi:hypothetical protein